MPEFKTSEGNSFGLFLISLGIHYNIYESGLR